MPVAQLCDGWSLDLFPCLWINYISALQESFIRLAVALKVLLSSDLLLLICQILPFWYLLVPDLYHTVTGVLFYQHIMDHNMWK